MRENAIAVIGMAGRFPGARDIDAYWQNLCNAVESITAFAEEALRGYVPSSLLSDPNFVRARGVLDEHDYFDAAFFGFSPREAEGLDPQHRVFLELCHQALEDAGYNPRSCPGWTGVFGGCDISGYVGLTGDMQAETGRDKDFLTTLVSYKLNLQGPSIDVQTACSTSLVAVQMACQSLLCGQCDLALAGGVNVAAVQQGGYLYQAGGILSPDGHCCAFDAKARGTVAGNGAGVVVLKRLEDAQTANDHIYAVVLSAAVNNDGSRKVSYMAPGVHGQKTVIATALALADVPPESITCVEAHGTGTLLGDPIEIAALTQAFATSKKQFCAIGSVKTNVGHLSAAAGIAGFIKTVLALKHKTIPASLNCDTPNPEINFADTPFFVNTKTRVWSPGKTGIRRAGLSSFGIGGTNVHVILEEAPQPQRARPSRRRFQLLPLAARNPQALDQMRAQFAHHLRRHPATSLGDAAYTCQVGRRAFEHREAVVAGDVGEAMTALEAPSGTGSSASETEFRPVVMLFPGQGSQFAGMGRELYRHEPRYREIVDECCGWAQPALGLDLRGLLFPEKAGVDHADRRLRETRFTQPALFIVEYAAARLLIEWGVEPRGMLGMSVGEFTAAALAAVFQPRDALAAVCKRAELMQSCKPGAMLAVFADPGNRGAELMSAGLEIAVSAPGCFVAGGPVEAIDSYSGFLSGAGIAHRALHTSHAFHTASMEPILERFHAFLSRFTLAPPRIPFVSNLTGTWISPEEATRPRYWVDQLRHTARLDQGLNALLAEPGAIALEVGPGGAMEGYLRQHGLFSNCAAVIATMKNHNNRDEPDDARLLQAVGRLWVHGGKVDWEALHQGESRQRVSLPTYPFQRKRFHAAPAMPSTPLPNDRREIDSWLYSPSWKQAPLPVSAPSQSQQTYLVFAIRERWVEYLVASLVAQGHVVVEVRQGRKFEVAGPSSFRLRPSEQQQYGELVRALAEKRLLPNRIIHCWAAGRFRQRALSPYAVRSAAQRGYYSVAWLAQALSEQMQDRSTVLTVLGTGLANITGSERLLPENAMVLGPLTTVPQECEGIATGYIDIAPPQSFADAQALCRHVLAEISAPSAQPFVALRGSNRWLRHFEPMPAPEGSSPLREHGVYLITGGWGRIGFALARHLAQRCRARLAMVGTTPWPPRDQWDAALRIPSHPLRSRLERLKELEALGAEVFPISADASDFKKMKEAVRLTCSRFGALHGVVHAAGLVGAETRCSLSQLGRDESESTFRPKVYGWLAVEAASRGIKLDFFISTSSLASIAGGPNLCAYSAANAFLDLASRQHRRDRPDSAFCLSLGLDGWQSNAALPAIQAANPTTSDTMTESEGLEIFERAFLLAARVPQVFVSTTDLGSRLAQSVERRVPPAELLDHDRPKLEMQLEPARTELERKLIGVWQRLFGIADIGIRDDFFKLGGHSMLATRMALELRRQFEVDFPLHEIYTTRTIEELGRWVETHRYTAGKRLPRSVLALRRSSGTETPVFLVPPTSGSPMCYLELARFLPSTRPCYGFQAPGLQDDLAPLKTIAAMADHYIEAMRGVQIEGPYILGGWSFGGIVAFEMARRLREAGQESTLLLIDSAVFEQTARVGFSPTLLAQIAREMVGYARQLPLPRSYRDLRNLGQWVGVSLPENFGDFLHRPFAEKLHFVVLMGREIRAAMRVSRLNVAAVSGYRPQPHCGRTEFFQVLPDSPRSAAILTALHGFTHGNLRTHKVSGNHMTVMLDAANVAVLADRIQTALAIAPDLPEAPGLTGRVLSRIDAEPARQPELVTSVEGE